jgi:lysophospholipase L1-like esterase
MFRRLLLLAPSLLVALLLAEGMVRLSGLAPDVGSFQIGRYRLSANPALGYEPVPNFAYDGEVTGMLAYAGRANSLGFRDREHPVAKPAGTLRVLVLGDSIADGMRIDDGEAILHRQLERRLRERGLAVDVLNFAVSGYNTGQEVETLASKGLAFAPDLVLVAYCHNDRRHADGAILATLIDREGGGQGSLRSDPRLLTSALFRLIAWRVLAPPDTEVGIYGRDTLRPLRQSDRDQARQRYPAIFADTVSRGFFRLARLSHQHGFQSVVAIFPQLNRLSTYPLEDEHVWVRERAEEVRLGVVDLLPAFRRCEARGVTVGLDKLHPTVEGHACAADALADALAPRLARIAHRATTPVPPVVGAPPNPTAN